MCVSAHTQCQKPADSPAAEFAFSTVLQSTLGTKGFEEVELLSD